MEKSIYIMLFVLCVVFVGIVFLLKYIGYRSKSPIEYTQTIPDSIRDICEYEDFILHSINGAIVPGLREGVTPQGICYIEDQDVFLITGYHKGGAPSVVFVIDRESKLLVKSVLLYANDNKPFCGHVGGIASDGKWVWISSEKSIYMFSYEVIEDATNMEPIVLCKNGYIS